MSVNFTEQIENYAHLINESTNIDCHSIVTSLDEISQTFESYLKIIETSEIEMKTYHDNLNPIIEEKQTQIEFLYTRIDKLNMFFECLNQKYSMLEKKMEFAERKIRKPNILKEFIDSTRTALPVPEKKHSQPSSKMPVFHDDKITELALKS